MQTTETKWSLLTSEFWIHLALQIFFVLDTAQVYNYLPSKWSGLVQAIMAAAYMASRGVAKSGVGSTPTTSSSSSVDGGIN